MQHALGLSGDAAAMFAIMVALAVAGIVALFMALFWPRRWHMSYRVEVAFAFVLVALAFYADRNSADTFHAYQSVLPTEPTAGVVSAGATPAAFDREITVLTFQWGFLFIKPNGEGARNATVVKPGERILFRILSNDVIHGFNIPAARLITEVDPGGVRLVWIRAPDTPGKYLIQCVDYCGVGHAQMKAWLVVRGEAPDHDDERPHG